jgi:hypothetical protein
MLIFVVARSRLDRYEELRRQFEDWRRAERRHRLYDQPFLKLGWSVVDTGEFVS